MRVHFAMCRPDQSILRLAGRQAGCLLCLLTRAGVECAQQCIGESVLEPHLISLISAGTGGRVRDQGPGAQHSFVCTPRCACPYEHCMMDDVCVCVCA